MKRRITVENELIEVLWKTVTVWISVTSAGEIRARLAANRQGGVQAAVESLGRLVA